MKKSYYCFISINDTFVIEELNGKSKKILRDTLRNLGFSVKLILSKKVYEKYQQKEVVDFFSIYGYRVFSLEQSKYVLVKMFGK